MDDFPQIMDDIIQKWVKDGNNIEDFPPSLGIYNFDNLTKEQRDSLLNNLENLME